MPTLRPVFAQTLFSLGLLCTVVAAQGQTAPLQAERQPVVASASSERVRFAAPNRVARLKLEVLSPSGEVLSELSSKGSVLDWALADGQGSRLPEGTYLCVLTLKDISGCITQRLTFVDVAGGGVTARPASPADLTARQAEAVGPVEAEAAGVVAGAEAEAPAATLLAHDGTQGQVVTTRGDLSSRGGDFFTGRDRELMRLSADGSLEVVGQFSARGGIRNFIKVGSTRIKYTYTKP